MADIKKGLGQSLASAAEAESRELLPESSRPDWLQLQRVEHHLQGSAAPMLAAAVFGLMTLNATSMAGAFAVFFVAVIVAFIAL